MGREIITIQIGQAGIQIGNALWELYCMEHGITANGTLKSDFQLSNSNRLDTLFCETDDSKFIPRAIFMDLEPTVIDEVRTGCYKNLFNPTSLVNGYQDAAGNFARGYFNVGKSHIYDFMETIRKAVNNCDHLALFEMLNSYPGGTGSGLTCLILDRLSDEYPKTYRFETGIFPSTMSESTVGPYNSLLYTHSTFENLDCGILVDNESIYNKLCYQLDCHKPTFSMINRFLSQMLSCIFLSHRYNYEGSQRMDVQELMTNSVPYPRIHFPVLAYAPIFNVDQMKHEITKPMDLIRHIFQTNSHFLNCPMQLTKYISCCLLFRGMVSPKEVYDAVASVKGDERIQFVDWCPTGFKIGINNQPSLSTPNHALAASNRTLCMMSGNVGIKEAWRHLRIKFEVLAAKKAFMHWFVGEGLEENDFYEANEDIKVLEQDYEEIAKDSEVNEGDAGPTRPSVNTNNIFQNRERSNQLNLSKELSQNNCTKKSYSRIMYENIVTRLDTKMDFSQNKMIKKLKKLQSRLNNMNKVFIENNMSMKTQSTIPKIEISSNTDKATPNKSNSDSTKSELMKDNIVLIKKLIRRDTMNKLAFSNKEQMICTSRKKLKEYSSSDSSRSSIDGSSVSSVPSVFI